jgi:hypothetical protein
MDILRTWHDYNEDLWKTKTRKDPHDFSRTQTHHESTSISTKTSWKQDNKHKRRKKNPKNTSKKIKMLTSQQ